MPKAKLFPVQNNFTAGKISPLAISRKGLRYYANGLSKCKNFIVLPHGGVGRRGGFVKSADSGSQTITDNVRIAPFQFSSDPTQSYILEFYPNFIHFFKSDGTQITDGGTPYKVVTSWDNDDIPNLRWRQSADVMYIVDGNNIPHELIRKGETNWVLQQMPIIGTPFSPGNKVTYDLYTFYNSYRNIGGTLKRTNSLELGELFDDNQTQVSKITSGIYPLKEDVGINFVAFPTEPSYVEPDFITENRGKFIENNYALQVEGNIYIPLSGDWYFSANMGEWGDFAFGDDSEYILTQYGLRNIGYVATPVNPDAFANYTFNNTQYTRHVKVESVGAGLRYFKARIGVTADSYQSAGFQFGYRYGGDIVSTYAPFSTDFTMPYRDIYEDTDGINVNEAEWHGDRCFEVKVEINTSSTYNVYYREIVGIDENGDILSDEYGDWRAIYTERTIDSGAAHVIKETGPGGPLAGNTILAYIKWAEGGIYTAGEYWTFKVGFLPIPASAFENSEVSQETSYPHCVEIHDNRLFFANTDARPNTIWGSKVGDYRNFVVDQTNVKPDDSIEFTISSNRVDPIMWLSSAKKLLAGTRGAEYEIDFDLDTSIPNVKANTFYGSEFIEPSRVGTNILFVEKNAIRIRDYYYRFDIDSYEGDDRSIISYEEIKDGIKELVFQQGGKPVFITSGTGEFSSYSGINVPPVNILWLIDNNGNLKGITYEKEHKVVGWHEHSIGTAGDWIIESIAVIPGTNKEDVLWGVIRKNTERYIGYLSNTVGKDNDEEFNAILTTLPFDIEQNNETLLTHKKRWVNINVYIYSGNNIKIARGSVDFDSNAILIPEVTKGLISRKINLFGWEKESYITIKSINTVDSDTYPAIIASIYGEIQINE